MNDEVFAVGYRRLPGPRSTRWAAWPIARTALSLAFRKRSAKLAAVLCAFVVVGHAIVLVGQVLVGRLGQGMAESGRDADLVGTLIVGIVGEAQSTLSGFIGFQMFATALLLAVVAGGLVAEDRRTHAFELYFSRPLRRRDYAVGKLLAAILVATGTIVVPLVVLWGIAAGISPDPLAAALVPLLLPGLAGALFAAVFLACGIVGVSASAERGTAAGVVYMVAFLFLSALADGLFASGHHVAGYLGPHRDVQTVADALLGVGAPGIAASYFELRHAPNDSAWLSALALLAFSVAGLAALAYRLRREVAR